MSLAVEEKTRVENEIEDATAVDIESYDFKERFVSQDVWRGDKPRWSYSWSEQASNNVNNHPRWPNQELVHKGLHTWQ